MCSTLPASSFFPGKEELPDPELLVERLLKRRTFRPDPQGTNLMFAFFAQHFTHQFFKTYNRMGLGFTKALDHGVSCFSCRRKINITGNYILILTEEKHVGYKSERVEKGAWGKYNSIISYRSPAASSSYFPSFVSIRWVQDTFMETPWTVSSSSGFTKMEN